MRINIIGRDQDIATVAFAGAAGTVSVEGMDGVTTVRAHETLDVTAGAYDHKLKAVDSLGHTAYVTVPAYKPKASAPRRKTAARAHRNKAVVENLETRYDGPEATYEDDTEGPSGRSAVLS